jgi:hypothetical protein
MLRPKKVVLQQYSIYKHNIINKNGLGMFLVEAIPKSVHKKAVKDQSTFLGGLVLTAFLFVLYVIL